MIAIYEEDRDRFWWWQWGWCSEKTHPQEVKVNSCLVVSDSLWPHGLQPTRLLCPWNSPGKNTEWVAISFSNAWKWKVKVKLLSRVRPLANPWTAAYQAPPSMAFSRQEDWSGVPLPSLPSTGNMRKPVWSISDTPYLQNYVKELIG